jgi:hypothetical protein
MTTVRYSVWVHYEDVDDDTENESVTDALREIPGFVQYSWEDSYDD